MIYQDHLNEQDLQRYARAMNARAKRVKSKGKLTAESLRDRIFESVGCCEWCGVDLVDQEFELDHITSLSQQGLNTPDNLVVACPDCNRRKSGKHPARFASEIYSETGHKTRLIDKILNDYDMSSAKQLSLFENESSLPGSQIKLEEDTPSIPPYNWST